MYQILRKWLEGAVANVKVISVQPLFRVIANHAATLKPALTAEI